MDTLGAGVACPATGTKGGPIRMRIRPSVVTFLAVTVAASLTVTALALAMPGASAPRARDLPRIVSEQSHESAAATAPVRPASSAASKVSASATPPARSVAPSHGGSPSAGTSSGSGKPHHASTAPDPSNASGSSGGSGDSHGSDGHSSSSGGHDSSDHEVVAPRLHESSDSGHSGSSD